ncbi:MAG: hypothetical protein QOF66_5107 [Mycobacterium sp.]|nr:hypothetical protein [Mycobacterium sp.]
MRINVIVRVTAHSVVGRGLPWRLAESRNDRDRAEPRETGELA